MGIEDTQASSYVYTWWVWISSTKSKYDPYQSSRIWNNIPQGVKDMNYLITWKDLIVK